MIVTRLGMVIEVSPMQPSKAPLPIPVMVEGMTVFLQPTMIDAAFDWFIPQTALQLLGEPYLVFPVWTVMELSDVQKEYL